MEELCFGDLVRTCRWWPKAFNNPATFTVSVLFCTTYYIQKDYKSNSLDSDQIRQGGNVTIIRLANITLLDPLFVEFPRGTHRVYRPCRMERGEIKRELAEHKFNTL